MKHILIALSLLGVLFLTGCNTVKGFGEDIQKAGEHIEERASK